MRRVKGVRTSTCFRLLTELRPGVSRYRAIKTWRFQLVAGAWTRLKRLLAEGVSAHFAR